MPFEPPNKKSRPVDAVINDDEGDDIDESRGERKTEGLTYEAG